MSSSGETVTSVVSLSPALPKKVRKYKKNKRVEQPDVPPEIPAKGRVTFPNSPLYMTEVHTVDLSLTSTILHLSPYCRQNAKAKAFKTSTQKSGFGKLLLRNTQKFVVCIAELPIVVCNILCASCNSSTIFPSQQPKIAEESLTYAELELMKPLPEAKAAKTGTVYAQILFEDKPV